MGVTRHPLFTVSTRRRLASVPPDEPLIRLLEESFSRIECGGLAGRFYERLFAAHPELRAIFPADMTAQICKLDAALRQVVGSLRAPESLRDMLEELARRHAKMGLQPAHYTWVVDALLAAMADSLGGTWTDELAFEWRATLELVSEVMMGATGAASMIPCS